MSGGDYGFKVPVSGQKIPRGWFAALVRFVNSLILRGDGTWTQVSRDESGTSITLTAAAIEALTRPASGAPGSGSNQDLVISVSGNTATIGLSGSTATAQLVGTGSVSVTGNTSGRIEIGVSGGTSGGSSYPVWGSLITDSITPSWDSTYEHMDPEIMPASGYLEIQFYPAIDLSESQQERVTQCRVFVDAREVWDYQRTIALASSDSSPVPVILHDEQAHTDVIPVHSGSTVTATYYDNTGEPPPLYFNLYKDLS